MRQSRIYCQEPLSIGSTIFLDERNNHYLLHVLRVKPRHSLILFDGSGHDYRATVTTVLRKKIEVFIDEEIDASSIAQESPLNIALAIAISKGERMDWVMQKSTELGVTSIQPLVTQRVDVKLNSERRQKKLEHWRNIVIGACEQSGRSILPAVGTPLNISDWLTTAEPCDLKLLLRADGSEFSHVSNNRIPPASVSILIGPEGGLSGEEIVAAEKTGFIAIRFGNRILRTETAPIVAISLLQAHWGDF